MTGLYAPEHQVSNFYGNQHPIYYLVGLFIVTDREVEVAVYNYPQ